MNCHCVSDFIIVEIAASFERSPLDTLLVIFLRPVNLRIIIRVHLRESSPDFLRIAHHLVVEFLVGFRIPATTHPV